MNLDDIEIKENERQNQTEEATLHDNSIDKNNVSIIFAD